MPYSTDGRWITEWEKEREVRERKAIPAESYRRPFVLVGNPGGVKSQRYIYGKGNVNVRHKTLVVLDCGHGTHPLDNAVQHGWADTSWPQRLAEVQAIYGRLEYGVLVPTKDVHPLVDLTEEQQKAIVDAGKQLPRPLRAMTCNTCLAAEVEQKKQQEEAEYREKKAAWEASGAKAAIDRAVEEAQEKELYWEQLDMAVYDELEGRVTELVETALTKIGIDSYDDIRIDDEGGIGSPDYESIPTPIGSVSINVFTDEALERLGRAAHFQHVTLKLDRDAMAKVLTALGMDPAGLDVSITTNEVRANADERVAAYRGAKAARKNGDDD